MTRGSGDQPTRRLTVAELLERNGATVDGGSRHRRRRREPEDDTPDIATTAPQAIIDRVQSESVPGSTDGPPTGYARRPRNGQQPRPGPGGGSAPTGYHRPVGHSDRAPQWPAGPPKPPQPQADPASGAFSAQLDGVAEQHSQHRPPAPAPPPGASSPRRSRPPAVVEDATDQFAAFDAGPLEPGLSQDDASEDTHDDDVDLALDDDLISDRPDDADYDFAPVVDAEDGSQTAYAESVDFDGYDDRYDDGYEAAYPAELSDEHDADELDDHTARQQWLAVAAQLALGVIGGAAVWLAFNWLWMRFPALALAPALVVIAGLVWIVRKIRKAEDLQTTLLAVLVGLVVTVSPAALLLLSR